MSDIKWNRPDVERYGREAFNKCVKPPFTLPNPLSSFLPYEGKDKDTVILELCCWIMQLEKEGAGK